MDTVMNDLRLERENRHFASTGGRSQENRSRGFRPAFMDLDTHAVYDSCFADGTPAPIHLLDGLPDKVVLNRDAAGRVRAAKASIVAGFVLDARFYTRQEAAGVASRLLN